MGDERTDSEHERIAKAFHDEYEARAPQHGYETRPESAVAWEDVPEANRNLMVGTVAALLRQGVIYPASVLEERDRTIEQLKHRPYIQSLEESIGIAHANEGLAEERAEKAEAEAESLRSQLTEARAALQELVTLKDGPRDAQYELRKPRAWEAAREFLHRSGSAPSLEKR